MELLLNKTYQTTPEDLYPIIRKLIDELNRIWDVFWVDELHLKIMPDRQTEIVAIHDVDTKFVIIDALADIMDDGDENSVQDTQPIFMQLRKIAEETGAAILVIHHVNKMGDYRGSTAIPGAVDTMILVESADDSNFIKFKSLKVRDGSPFHFTAEAHWTESQFYLSVTDFDDQPTQGELGKPHRYVLRFLAKNHILPALGEINLAELDPSSI